ncbi:hypothetical protein HQ29_00445 [Porphyromonas canoris]|uniref:ribosome silencing factor n=1 Tax=Porphyromonas TaxID=836 RepID=UPI00051D27F1|nr:MULTISPECIES: ribosome silencing factor [Porphyromonas]KGL53873.1 hypothetical protein HQ29_00445 [Porphyromonas canoris]KGN96616.1 hypothetical protein HQ39_00725 [Porphyromonas sp. COT-108 OH2963]
MIKSKDIALAAIKGLEEKKGKDIVLLDLTVLDDPICDYMVIANGNTNTQVEALEDSVRTIVRKETGENPTWSDRGNGEWIAIDYISVMVHIFVPELRNYYALEQLWADAKITHIKSEE